MVTSLMPEVSDLSLGVRRLLRDFRKGRGLTQQRLGELVGVGGTTVSRVEGCRIDLSLERLEKMAQALGYRVDLRFTRLKE